MRLLFDQNLARRLVPKLAVEYPGSAHVADLNLDTASDRAIWDYAGVHGYVNRVEGHRLSTTGVPVRLSLVTEWSQKNSEQGETRQHKTALA